jgi:Tfp pilus assembly protein PilN
MTQHLNLLGPGLRPAQPPRWTLGQGLLGLGLIVLASLAAGLLMDSLGERARTELAATQQASDAMRQRLASQALQEDQGPSALVDAELRQLRRQDAALQRVRSVIASGSAGQTQGHAQLLLALARQADPSVWIAGLQVSANQEGLELRGRMNDPAALPAYLARLQDEPLFHGRRFGQLSIRRVEPAVDAQGAGAGYSEFVLRSQPGGVGPTDTPSTTVMAGARP